MRSSVVLTAVLLAGALVVPSPAAGAEPLRPPVAGEVLLAFGVPYASRVHRGLDLAADAGTRVAAPAAGMVTFAGRLPGEGGAVGVTLQTDDGLKITCLPLVSAKVVKGERVDAATVLGTVSAEGDDSTDLPHVHLSVRQGETYLDPAPLLAVAPAAHEAPEEESQPAGADAPEAQGVAEGAPTSAPQGANAASGRPRASTAAQAAPAAEPAPSAADVRPRPSVSLAPVRSAASSAVGRHALSSPRRITRVSPATSGGLLSAIVARASSGVALVAELLVALALLWPVWRRLSQPVELGETVPVRARS